MAWHSKLEDVFYVSNLSKNLFSVGDCINKKVTFKKEFVEFFMNDELKAREGAKQSNNLFRMFIKIQHKIDENLATVSNLKRWHERLGHITISVCSTTIEGWSDRRISKGWWQKWKYILRGMSIWKAASVTLQHATKRKPLARELIHSYVCGSISQDSIRGSKFFVSFKDDYSAYHIVYFIKHKSDVVDKLKEFIGWKQIPETCQHFARK